MVCFFFYCAENVFFVERKYHTLVVFYLRDVTETGVICRDTNFSDSDSLCNWPKYVFLGLLTSVWMTCLWKAEFWIEGVWLKLETYNTFTHCMVG